MTPRRPATRPLAVAAAVLLALGAAGCSGAGGVSVTAGPTAQSAPASGSQVGTEEFAAALKRPGTTLLDVRTPAEFAEGHLPGAVNIDLSAPDFADRIAALPPDAAYAVYCRTGSRSAEAVSRMTDAGFTGAFDLAGGISAWQEAGGEVVDD
ncbi:rhodanese-like domain-containing protein [Phycicoccus flavus]|uniref:rhodanese-like domain-containing protein n=1 Tax=Phycicoccus flavus TaxID=2502783 RepID=UPI000FEB96F6|nr:rhodanese-like domain-containing protein [Phycicoccus flavus]NHA69422.1 rhodanese-like domain-containing protein [Phycicoccus flavus]